MVPQLRQQALVAVCAAIYTRISSDPSGQRAGVERQRADCEEYCLARDWQVAELFEDNDYSASSGRRRPAYERMLAAVESRRIDAIVTWHNDRLHRSPKELEAFIDLVERTRVRLAVVTGGDYEPHDSRREVVGTDCGRGGPEGVGRPQPARAAQAP